MEVHAHSHTARKKWSHYFWEFLMLFLAVFCGFLAENWREHYIERIRVKEFAENMYEDLKADTLQIRLMMEDIKGHELHFDSTRYLFDQAPPVSNYRLLKAVLPQRTTYPLVLTTTTFNQMKSSGSLRYLHNKSLTRVMNNYYEVNHVYITRHFDYVEQFFLKEIQPFMLDHFDYNQSDFETDTLKAIDPVYIDRTSKTDLLLRNRLALYTSMLSWGRKYALPSLLQQTNVLIGKLKEEYHLE